MSQFKTELAALIAKYDPQSDDDFAQMVVDLSKATAGIISFRAKHHISLLGVLGVARQTMMDAGLEGFKLMQIQREKEKTARG